MSRLLQPSESAPLAATTQPTPDSNQPPNDPSTPEEPASTSPDVSSTAEPPASAEDDSNPPEFERVPLDVDASPPPPSSARAEDAPTTSLYEDPPSEEDGDGEWITPDNVATHKSRALQMLPTATHSNNKKGAPPVKLDVACMTVDYAMQNVLLQMGLNLVGTEGRRVASVKTWVLRCHACFK